MADELIVHGGGQVIELAIAAWLDAKGKRSGSPHTVRAYGDTLRKFRAYLFAHSEDLDGDTRAVALLAQAWMREQNLQGATLNTRLAILSSFYTFANKQGLLPIDNPISRVERAKQQRYRGARPLDFDEVRQRLAGIDRNTPIGARDHALLLVGLQTGRRVSELANLRLGDVEIHGARVILHWRRTKGGKSMNDTLPSSVGRVLLEWLDFFYGSRLRKLPPDTPVWVSLSSNGTWGRPLDVQSIADICQRHLGTSKVHSLRHTFARAMEDSGAKVSDIQARLGHESLDTTGRYLAALNRAENPQADKIAALFGAED